jgi:hypothetical protein
MTLDLDKDLTWSISRQNASRLQHLGIQDAPKSDKPQQKRQVHGQEQLSPQKIGTITQTVSQEKWNKGKEQIRELTVLLQSCPDAEFDFKRLEHIRGFLCHLSMTF